MNFLYHFRTRGTGAEGVHIAGVALALRALGHSVTFSSPTGADPTRSAGDDPFAGGGAGSFWSALSRRCPRFLFELLEIAYNIPARLRNGRILRQQPIDVVYERHAFFLCSTAFLCRRKGIPLIIEVNELVGDERIREQPFLRRLAAACDRLSLSRASLIVVVSPHLKRRIVALGIPEERVLVLPNAVRREEYAVPADGRAVRDSFGLTGKTVVGFVGWLVHWHNLEELATMFCRLARGRDDLRLVLVGDGPLRPSLEGIAEREGAKGKLIVTGAVPHTEIPAHIAAMDIGVIPHSNEYRSPIKLFEYMGQGIAVLAPDTEPIRMVVTPGANGKLFRNGDAEDLSAKLVDLLANAADRQSLGRQARADVLAKHTWTNNVTRVLARLGTAGGDGETA